MKVLLIEDEKSVSSFIKKGLEDNNIMVMQAFDGAMGVKLSQSDDFDVIILDIVLPEINGLEVCSIIRKNLGNSVGILMLTASGTTDDIVEGLTTGADDYLLKPFRFRELLARVYALARRRQNTAVMLKVADLEMNTDAKEVTRAGKKIDLTAREFRLLEYLLRHQNKVVARVDILENVWDVNHDVGTNVVDVYINYLRKKIDNGFDLQLIRTVKGMGYTIKDSVDENSK
jgi:two-component system, OmpR family, copper resistance phosphate regulon response regulator CusR